MEQSIVSPTMMPHAAGGKAGHARRIIPCIFTVGIAFPNTLIVGMVLAEIQKLSEGGLYSKKTDTTSKSRF